MAVAIQFATPAITRSGETLYVNFADGSAIEIVGASGLQEFVASNTPTTEQVKAMAIANRLSADPLLDSPEKWDGKTITLDLEQSLPANVFKVV